MKSTRIRPLDLPGVEPDRIPDRIELTIEKNVLTVSAERRSDRQEGDAVVAAERLQGSSSASSSSA